MEIKILAPDFRPGQLAFQPIPKFLFQGSLEKELTSGRLTVEEARRMLEVMLLIRAFEEMIVDLKGRRYEPVPGFVYGGPTHVSIGQEGVAAGAIAALDSGDYITSTHRGHGHAIAKGFFAIHRMDREALLAFLRIQGGFGSADEAGCDDSVEALRQRALQLHLYKTVAELFGKEDGYCRGRGGSMHIADFYVGHLGANAIVAGSSAIATGAAIAAQKLGQERVCVCFLGDGAVNNGVFMEALNFASMRQFARGTPVIFLVENNYYGMTGRTMDEVTGLDYLARRAAGFAPHNLHAEIVNGMDVLAVRDAVARARARCLQGEGPVFLECLTYRYYGHSLSDDGTRYRGKEEVEMWRQEDPILRLYRQLAALGIAEVADLPDLKALQERATETIRARAAEAARAADPRPEDIYDGLLAPPPEEAHESGKPAGTGSPDSASGQVAVGYRPDKVRKVQRNARGEILFRHAVAEAIVEEMVRDRRVVLFGEDVARYGGAFQVTHGIQEIFGRERVFDTPISEACIVGVAAGMSMAGLRPIAEIMYIDFILQAMDQLANQACKTRYMFGGKARLPMVIRTTVGGGRGYAGQHSQSLESIIAHFPGVKIAAPATPYDAKGLLKAAVRDDNPVVFIEHQLLYTHRGVVPPEEYLVPFGRGVIRREGSQVSLIAYSWMVHVALAAAELLSGMGVEAEVVDIRTLVPLDVDLMVASAGKTGRAVVLTQSPLTASYAQHLAFLIQHKAFSSLKAPVEIVSAHEVPPPMAGVLERESLPSPEKVARRVLQMLGRHRDAERFPEVPHAVLAGRGGL